MSETKPCQTAFNTATELYAALCDFIELTVATQLRHDDDDYTPDEQRRVDAFGTSLSNTSTPHLVVFLARAYADLAVVLFDHTNIHPDTVLTLLRQACATMLDEAESNLRARGAL